MEIQLVFAFVLLAGFTQAAEWDYGVNGPSKWGDNFPICGNASKKQSPIDIVTDKVEKKKDLGPFLANTFTAPTTMIMKNNGHSVQVDVTGGYTITNKSVLPNNYKLVQFHFHWAVDGNAGGSEHKVNGKQYFGELHLVHYNTKYPNSSVAKSEPNGLAVLGVFLQAAGSTANSDYEKIFTHLQNVTLKGDSIAITPTFTVDSLLPKNLSHYYRYDGSLTTPTCDESVIWTVFSTPVQISMAQATQLSSSVYEKNETNADQRIGKNFRPVQNIFDRKVYVPGRGTAIKASILFTTILCYLATKLY